MKILHYTKEAIENLDTTYKTKNNEEYSINYPNNLIIDSDFLGKNINCANSQGWERDCIKYFETLLKIHPEYFSENNIIKIKNNNAPVVNKRFLEYFPQYGAFLKQKLVVHHIGGDGQMVAIPENIHSKGFGEVHNIEKKLGIRDVAMSFSNQVEIQINNGKLERGKNVIYYYDSLKERKGVDDGGYKYDSENESGNNNIIANKTNNEVNDNYEITKKEKIGTIIKYTVGKIGAKVLSSAIEIGLPIAADLVFEKIKRKFNISMTNKPSIDNQTKNETGLKIIVKNKESNISDEAECHNYPKERVPMAPHIRHAHLHHFGKNGEILKMLDDIHVNKNKGNGIEDMKDYN